MQFSLIELLGVLGSTGIIAGLFGYKLQNAVVKRTNTADVKDNLAIYQELINDLKKQFEQRINEMEAELTEVKQELQRCKQKYKIPA